MPLTAIEVRILGALVEKELTTPDAYPLSLNALTNACNQTSSRDPVMELTEDQVRWAVNNLRQQSLVRAIQGAQSRVMKYQHLLATKLELDTAALAIMCVLMLRGAQTPGEIKGRTGRLFEFPDVSDVDATLAGLAARELVAQLPRRPGQKEARYQHLLAGPPPDADSQEPAAVVETAHSPQADRLAALESSVDELRRELAELREKLDAFVRQFEA